jgi:hypothetical protein
MMTTMMTMPARRRSLARWVLHALLAWSRACPVVADLLGLAAVQGEEAEEGNKSPGTAELLKVRVGFAFTQRPSET